MSVHLDFGDLVHIVLHMVSQLFQNGLNVRRDLVGIGIEEYPWEPNIKIARLLGGNRPDLGNGGSPHRKADLEQSLSFIKLSIRNIEVRDEAPTNAYLRTPAAYLVNQIQPGQEVGALCRFIGKNGVDRGLMALISPRQKGEKRAGRHLRGDAVSRVQFQENSAGL